MLKNALVFLVAAGLALLGAVHRWDDSAHAIGLISSRGGASRHPTALTGGQERYTMIATATVLPGYRGDVRVALQGQPGVPHVMHNARPVVDLGIRHTPRFENETYYGLLPGDHVSLWVMMKPPRADPICGMACKDGFLKGSFSGKAYCFCSAGCQQAFARDPEKYRDRDHLRGTYHLSFTDVKTGRQVLDMPITFTGNGGSAHGQEHVH